MDWASYNSDDCWGECFYHDLICCISSNQMLILVRDSKYDNDDEIYFDMAIYDSAFPYLQNKRYCKDRRYFYLPYAYIVEVIGHRFEGYSEDIIDFLTNMEISLPHIMNLDTIQRTDNFVNVFGLVSIHKGTVLPIELVSGEHSGLLPLNSDGILSLETDTQFNKIRCKLGGDVNGFHTLVSALLSDKSNFVHPHVLVSSPECSSSGSSAGGGERSEGELDLLGGRLKFHEAMNCDTEEVRRVSVKDRMFCAEQRGLSNSKAVTTGRKRDHSEFTADQSLNEIAPIINSNTQAVTSTTSSVFLSKGVIECFLRESLEELNIHSSEVKHRGYVDSVHYIYCCKNDVNLLLQIYLAEEAFVYVVELCNYSASELNQA